MATLQQLETHAREIVQAVADDPQARLELREAFYLRYGHATKLIGEKMLDPEEYKYGYGRSELDFMRWEMRRGVLNPMRGPRPGSAWWRNVNLEFLYLSELAALVYEAGIGGPELPTPVEFWLRYFREPSEITWYHAHNASIVSGYLNQTATAELERRGEQIFMNVVLYRLLYAQALAEGVALSELGEIFADPRLPSVALLVHIPDFYPIHYPLTRADVRHIMHRGHSIEEVVVSLFDDILIISHLKQLYEHAAASLRIPALSGWLRDGEPVYPSLKPFSLARHALAKVVQFIEKLLGKH